MAIPTTGLTGATRDAAVAITALFTTYGLASLAPSVIQYLKEGYAPETVTVLLQQTTQYKQRFAANDARIKAGLPVLSPAEYLATERAYGQVLKKYGLPAGFYDSHDDFKAFLEKDLSPTELDSRAKAASDFITRNDPQQLAYFRQYYTDGDMIAFALDSKRAEPLVGKAFEAASIGGTAATQGLSIDKTTAERIAGQGITAAQASQGFGIVASDLPVANALSDIYGDELTQEDLIAATFENDAAAGKKVRTLASKERAAFGGKGGAAATALSKSSGGI